jgi:hypothetical protein
MSYARGAAIFCQKREFWEYIEFKEKGVTVRHPDSAADWLYATMEMQSRAEIDHSAELQAKWMAIVKDFNDWLKGYGARQKTQPWRSADYRLLAKFAPCMRCGKFKGTGKVVCCHVMGELAWYFGKGKAEKPSDFASAYLCHDCHGTMDAYANSEDPGTRTLEWAMLILRTHEWLWRHDFIQMEPA